MSAAGPLGTIVTVSGRGMPPRPSTRGPDSFVRALQKAARLGASRVWAVNPTLVGHDLACERVRKSPNLGRRGTRLKKRHSRSASRQRGGKRRAALAAYALARANLLALRPSLFPLIGAWRDPGRMRKRKEEGKKRAVTCPDPPEDLDLVFRRAFWNHPREMVRGFPMRESRVSRAPLLADPSTGIEKRLALYRFTILFPASFSSSMLDILPDVPLRDCYPSMTDIHPDSILRHGRAAIDEARQDWRRRGDVRKEGEDLESYARRVLD